MTVIEVVLLGKFRKTRYDTPFFYMAFLYLPVILLIVFEPLYTLNLPTEKQPHDSYMIYELYL